MYTYVDDFTVVTLFYDVMVKKYDIQKLPVITEDMELRLVNVNSFAILVSWGKTN